MGTQIVTSGHNSCFFRHPVVCLKQMKLAAGGEPMLTIAVVDEIRIF